MRRADRNKLGRKRLLLTVAALAAAVIPLATVAAATTGDAAAHPSDCHAAQTCPSDDHSYVWYDGAGQGWDCAARAPSDPLPAGATVIVAEGAEFACQAVAPPPATTTTDATTTEPAETPTETTAEPDAAPAPEEPPVTQPAARPARPARPQPRPAPGPTTTAPAAVAPVFLPPPRVRPKLTAGRYVFPVFGPVAFVDTFGAPRATVSWHHGTDIFAPKGAPVLAVADGTVFSVGWNDIGGNRLWLRDRQGNEFYYAHLAAFSTLAVNGAHVRAGAVLGFVGDTGDARGTPPHLHFEIHPVGLLALGYDGAVNPTPYLRAWQRLQDLSFVGGGYAVVPGPGGRPAAPTPGAIFLGSSDISNADGLAPADVRRALRPPPRGRDVRAMLERLGATPSAEGGSEHRQLERELERAALEHATTAVDELEEETVWDLLAWCESSGDWSANTGNGYFGGLQFAASTWLAYGGGRFAPSANYASREEQIAVAREVLAAQGWAAWPACSASLGLRAAVAGR